MESDLDNQGGASGGRGTSPDVNLGDDEASSPSSRLLSGVRSLFSSRSAVRDHASPSARASYGYDGHLIRHGSSVGRSRGSPNGSPRNEDGSPPSRHSSGGQLSKLSHAAARSAEVPTFAAITANADERCPPPPPRSVCWQVAPKR